MKFSEISYQQKMSSYGNHRMTDDVYHPAQLKFAYPSQCLWK